MTLPRKSYGERKRFNSEVLRGAGALTCRVAWYLHDALSIAAFHEQEWIQPTHQVVADALGCSRRSVIRAYVVLIKREAFRFSVGRIQRDGEWRKRPWKVAFLPAADDRTQPPERRVRAVIANVTDLSKRKCDKGVTSSTEGTKAETGPRLKGLAGLVSGAVPPQKAPPVDPVTDRDWQRYERDRKGHRWWPSDGGFSDWQAIHGGEARKARASRLAVGAVAV